jgi:hypothetical protein
MDHQQLVLPVRHQASTDGRESSEVCDAFV